MGGTPARVQRPIDGSNKACNAPSEANKDAVKIIKTLFVGDTKTGKTNAVFRMAEDDFNNHHHLMIPIDFRVRYVNLDGVKLKVYLWDTTHPRYRTPFTPQYRGTHGFMIFYDVSRQSTFDNVKHWLMEVRKYGPSDASVMVVGTKSDLSDEKVVDYEVAKDFCVENDLPFMEISAKDGTNSELALMTLIAMINNH